MAGKGHALSRDELVRALIAYTGTTTDDGNPAGTTLQDRHLIGRNDFISNKTILIGSGAAAIEDSGAVSFAPGTGIIEVSDAFSAQIKAGTLFRILNISSVEIDVDVINTKIGTNTDPAGTNTLFAWLAKIFAGSSNIFAIVNAMLVLTETGGTVTTTGGEDDVYINDAPAGVFEPRKVMIDFTNQTAAETVVVRTYYRIKSLGNYIKKDEETFADVQDPPLINVELEPNRFGIKVTIERTAGVAKDYDWCSFYEV